MIITLSRQMGAYGELIAARVAAATGLRLVDREYVYHAALAAGLPDKLLRQLMYERVRSLAAEIFESLGGTGPELGGVPLPSPNPLGGLIGPMLPPASLSLDEGVRTLGLVIKDIAAQGNVLLLGQAGQAWLRDYTGATHVQIVAPFDLRVSRVSAAQKVSVAEARRMVRASDHDRADNLGRYHGLSWGDPLLYHLVINTGQAPVEVAVSLIVHAGQALAARS